jgi:predicted RNA-binding Zn ribbon-like protein
VNLSSYADLAVRLANTAAQAPGEPDSLGTAEACASALGDSLAGPVTRRDLVVLAHLRDEFTAIFTAAATGDDKGAIGRMNALLIQYPIQPELVSHDDQRWHVHLAGHGSAADRFAAGAIIGMSLIVSLYGVNRLGICAIASCHRVFIDASPGRSRRYCTEHVAAKGNVSTLRRQPEARRPGRATPAAS